MGRKKTILVAPLHWGLGHVTRCIPIIQELIEFNFNVIIASDGAALLLLKKEFPQLKSIELPCYNISYPRKEGYLKWKLLQKLPTILKVISSEKKIVHELVSERLINGIISDNRPGVRSDKIPSVYITHQLNVLSGISSYFSNKWHQNIIKKFTECWVPDLKGVENLSGILSHNKNKDLNTKYIGILSRMKKTTVQKKYDILIILSGPEPQRTILERKLINLFRFQNKSVLMIQGCVDSQQKISHLDRMTIYNFMNSKALEQAINESELVITRSGYTSIMDLAIIGKKAYFIPTPGQYEQEYLAKRMEELNWAPFSHQNDFSIEKLKDIRSYKGLYLEKNSVNYTNLFKLFLE